LRTQLDTRAGTHWNYSVAGGVGFIATATRTSDPNVGETITIDQDGNTGGTWTP